MEEREVRAIEHRLGAVEVREVIGGEGMGNQAVWACRGGRERTGTEQRYSRGEAV